ncbi:MAG: hypothetical protein QM723_15165 [Myxococcaceae bacterium]
MDRIASDVATPEVLFNVLGALSGIELFDRATKVARRIEEENATNPYVLGQLSNWYQAMGDAQKCDTLREQAQALPAAGAAPVETDADRRYRTQFALDQRRFDEAARLLAAIEKPLQQPDFWLTFLTLDGLRKAGRAQEAYEVSKRAFAVFPAESARHHGVRSNTTSLEKQLGLPTIVPKHPTARRDALIGVGIAVTVIALVLIGSVVASQFQRVYLMNPSATRARIAVGTRVMTLEPGAEAQLTMAEGQYPVSVQLDNGYSYKTQIEISNGPLERLDGKNVFLYSVLGGGVFETHDVIYGPPGTNQPPEPTIFIGHDFIALHHVDDVFTDPPQSLSVEKNSTVTRTVLHQSHPKPFALLDWARKHSSAVSAADARAYAEGVILGGNRQIELIQEYRLLCQENAWDDAATQFLQRNGVNEF